MFKEVKQLKNNTKGKFFLTFYRLSSYFSRNKILRIIGFPIRLTYKLIFQWILGIDIPDSTRIGSGFNVYHGQGLIINKDTVIGNNVTARHNTTIGVAVEGGPSPVIGNSVNIGANCVIIGGITIGADSVIGAGSVVITNMPSNSIIVGNPGKVIKANISKNYEN